MVFAASCQAAAFRLCLTSCVQEICESCNCYTFGVLQDFDDVRRKLSGSGFQVVFDINGREAVEAEPLLDALAGRGGSLEQYIYCSSAGAAGRLFTTFSWHLTSGLMWAGVRTVPVQLTCMQSNLACVCKCPVLRPCLLLGLSLLLLVIPLK
jgi:hypothetical protein